MRYLSICSGIEAATVAWKPLGWEPVAFSEIEKFPSRVLVHHYPGIPNVGDFTLIDTAEMGWVDLLVGGTPCQAFSIAGKRLSLADARGNLTLAYAVLAHELARHNGLRWAVWENVPGCLNTPDNAFGCFLGALVGHDGAVPAPRGRKWPDVGMVGGPRARIAWIVRDAQYFGLAQRRARVFVVAGFADGCDPAEVLFERKSLQGNPSPRRETRKDIASTISARTKGGGGLETDAELDVALIAAIQERAVCENADAGPDGIGVRTDGLSYTLEARTVPQAVAYGGNNTSGPIDIATAVNAHGGPCGRMDFESETFVTHTLRAEGFDASEDGTGRGIPLVPMAFDLRGREGGSQFEGPHDTANIRSASGGSSRSYVAQHAVRRLTPTECERLQGFPDGYTAIPGAADGPRYKALGNSMAVPVMRWIGRRIAMQEAANDNTQLAKDIAA